MLSLYGLSLKIRKIMNLKLIFYSGVGSVTGANFLLQFDNKRVLVDCGLIQGEKFAMRENREDFGYDPKSIDMLFITHAHLDHIGRIPKLVKEGFKGPIYSTPETMSLAELILEDAVGILDKEARRDSVLPMYEMQDMKDAMALWQTIPYHTPNNFGEFSVYLKDAGHILGSSMIEFSWKNNKNIEKKILFTGDLGNSPSPLLRDTEFPLNANYMIMESVYGNRNHEPKEERIEKLKNVIKSTVERSGSVIIPSFSMERTQVIIYELNKLVESKVIPSIPVYIDSPLASRITEVYKASTNLFNRNIKEEIEKGDDVFDFPRLLFTTSGEMSREIDHSKSSKIIIAGSGMSVGGRVIHHEEVYLEDPKSTILLVGYQTLGTLGRHLIDGEKTVTINNNKIKVKAKIESILGYSSHKDSDNLVDFVSKAEGTLEKVFVVMGEPKASTFLAQRIRDEIGLDAVVPEREIEYELD